MNIIKMLSEELTLKENLLQNFIMTAPYRYKVYSIPKRNSSGSRVIAQPSKELKVLQRLAVTYLRDMLPVHKCATAYEKGNNIKINAMQHLGNSYLLKMDFENFFPSIVPNDLHFFIRSNSVKLTQEQIKLYSRLFFRREQRKGRLCLSIGAPSSPFISNAVMYDFDSLVSKKCDEQGVVYTRYADDLTFTTNRKNLLFDFKDEIINISKSVSHPSLIINQSKTIFSSKKYNRHVTGVTLTNDDKISVGRDRKRHVSCLVHKFSVGSLSLEDTRKLKGLLSFVCDIEPDFLAKLQNKYGENVLEQLKFIE